jgi:hypothetical protein
MLGRRVDIDVDPLADVAQHDGLAICVHVGANTRREPDGLGCVP